MYNMATVFSRGPAAAHVLSRRLASTSAHARRSRCDRVDVERPGGRRGGPICPRPPIFDHGARCRRAAVAFDPASALAAASYVADACWLLLRQNESVTGLPPLGEPGSPSAHLSGDLTLRFLPAVYRRAALRSAGDSLAAEFAEVLPPLAVVRRARRSAGAAGWRPGIWRPPGFAATLCRAAGRPRKSVVDTGRSDRHGSGSSPGIPRPRPAAASEHS